MTNIHSRHQKEMLNLHARLQSPSLEDFQVMATAFELPRHSSSRNLEHQHAQGERLQWLQILGCLPLQVPSAELVNSSRERAKLFHMEIAPRLNKSQLSKQYGGGLLSVNVRCTSAIIYSLAEEDIRQVTVPETNLVFQETHGIDPTVPRISWNTRSVSDRRTC